MTDWLLWVVFGLILIFGLVVVRGAPYVPSHRRFVKQSFKELYPLSKQDVMVDLGSGDGVVLRVAAEYGARAIGYEMNPILVGVSRLLSWGNKNIAVKTADYWLMDLPEETTLVYAFMVTRDVRKLERRMQQWANECGHQLWLMTYGAQLKDTEPVRMLNAHTLYLFTPEPLQARKA